MTKQEKFVEVVKGVLRREDHGAVIWDGKTYYSLCRQWVYHTKNGVPETCIKQYGHQSHEHEAFDGTTRQRRKW